MPTVAESIIARNDIPPGVPVTAMGALSPSGPVSDTAPAMKRITGLLKAARDRTSQFFGAAQTPTRTAVEPPITAPNFGSLRTNQLERGLDTLEQRSTPTPPPVAAANPPQPVAPKPVPTPTPPALGGMPAFDYRSYLNQNAMRNTEGKR